MICNSIALPAIPVGGGRDSAIAGDAAYAKRVITVDLVACRAVVYHEARTSGSAREIRAHWEFLRSRA